MKMHTAPFQDRRVLLESLGAWRQSPEGILPSTLAARGLRVATIRAEGPGRQPAH
jgi:hypothetical protein